METEKIHGHKSWKVMKFEELKGVQTLQEFNPHLY